MFSLNDRSRLFGNVFIHTLESSEMKASLREDSDTKALVITDLTTSLVNPLNEDSLRPIPVEGVYAMFRDKHSCTVGCITRDCPAAKL